MTRVFLIFSRVSELLDYTAEELTGMNMYTLCHGEDVQKLRKCHLDRKYEYERIMRVELPTAPASRRRPYSYSRANLSPAIKYVLYAPITSVRVARYNAYTYSYLAIL